MSANAHGRILADNGAGAQLPDSALERVQRYLTYDNAQKGPDLFAPSRYGRPARRSESRGCRACWRPTFPTSASDSTRRRSRSAFHACSRRSCSVANASSLLPPITKRTLRRGSGYGASGRRSTWCPSTRTANSTKRSTERFSSARRYRRACRGPPTQRAPSSTSSATRAWQKPCMRRSSSTACKRCRTSRSTSIRHSISSSSQRTRSMRRMLGFWYASTAALDRFVRAARWKRSWRRRALLDARSRHAKLRGARRLARNGGVLTRRRKRLAARARSDCRLRRKAIGLRAGKICRARPAVRLYGRPPERNRLPLFAFNIPGMSERRTRRALRDRQHRSAHRRLQRPAFDARARAGNAAASPCA